MDVSYCISNMLTEIGSNQYNPILERLIKIYAAMDQKYQEAADYYGFLCKGCEDNCCRTHFYHHTLIEYLYIKEGFNNLENRIQAKVMQRALNVCRKIDEADKKGKPIKLMCPVNVESLCILYPYRPMICRLHGIPHEIRRPGQGVSNSPGCGTFNLKCRGKERLKFDRTPFYIQMASLEKEMKQAAGVTQKIKMTVAQMIVTFGDGRIP